MEKYNPGKHIISSITSSHNQRLQDLSQFKTFLTEIIETNQLENLGEVYHQFENAGFTAVVCLSESHISVHTWPEYDKINLDIYLSNYKLNNNLKGEAIYQNLLTYFEGKVDKEYFLER